EAGDDDDFLALLELRGKARRVDLLDFAGRLLGAVLLRGGGRGAEAAEDDVPNGTVHRLAHDVGEDRRRRADERAGGDQEVVLEHEAGGRGGPTRVTVEH